MAKAAFKITLLSLASWTLTACSSGGDLTLEPGVKKAPTTSSPFVNLNQGGKALVIESGKTATTGVHGWVSIQTVSQKNLSSTSGTSAVINKVKAFE